MKSLSVILMVIFLLQGCEKNELAIPGGDCFAVSYVTGICGQAVLKIENPEFYNLGETWNGHENVFFTVFPCAVNENELIDRTFYVQVMEEFEADECVRCLAALDYTGSKKHPIKLCDQIID